MATISNRSRFRVTVKNRIDLEQPFPYSAESRVKDYVRQLKAQGLSPKVSHLDDSFALKIRNKGFKPLSLSATSYTEAEEIVTQIESERRRGLFVDYTQGWRITFSDLLRRYLVEEAPRKKSFESTAYRINWMLKDAGWSTATPAQPNSCHRKNTHPACERPQEALHQDSEMRWAICASASST